MKRLSVTTRAVIALFVCLLCSACIPSRAQTRQSDTVNGTDSSIVDGANDAVADSLDSTPNDAGMTANSDLVGDDAALGSDLAPDQGGLDQETADPADLAAVDDGDSGTVADDLLDADDTPPPTDTTPDGADDADNPADADAAPLLGGVDQTCLPDGVCNDGLTCENDLCKSLQNSTIFGTVLAVGNTTVCTIRPENKSLWCWGGNWDGLVASTVDFASSVPQLFDDSAKWRDVSLDQHGCAVTQNGGMKCWGRNAKSQLGVPGGDSAVPLAVAPGVSWRDVEVGGQQSCAIAASGALYCWGDGGVVGTPPSENVNVSVPTLVDESGLSWKMVSVGYAHVCGIVPDAVGDGAGALYCWGHSYQGQLGIGTPSSSALAFDKQKPVAGRWRWVTAGGSTTCAIKDDDSLWCWGDNYQKQFGTNTAKTSSLWPDPGPAGTWERVDAAASFVCATRKSGGVFCWGDNQYGQLGIGQATVPQLPIQLPGGWWRVMPARNGYTLTCGITTEGVWKCWGSNFSGQVGNGVKTWEENPTLVSDTMTFTSVSAGDRQVCGLNDASKLFCWGVTNEHPGGPLNQSDLHTTPFAIGNSAWSQLTVGQRFACGISGDKALCWGDNSDDTLGLGSSAPPYVSSPAPLSVNGENVTHISSGAASCAITASEDLYCWGRNWGGGLGLGDKQDRDIPTQVTTPQGVKWKRVSVGGHSCGILKPQTGEAGLLYCWGNNYFGQLGIGDTVEKLAPEKVGSDLWLEIAVGAGVTCGIRFDKALYCWGEAMRGQLGLGNIASNQLTPQLVDNTQQWREISVGFGAVCAIQSSGTPNSLWCWGENIAGQLGTGDFANRNIPTLIAPGKTWLSVTAGAANVCAIGTNGQLWCWGDNAYGQLGTGTSMLEYLPTAVAWPDL